MFRIITLDGGASSGKSTTARLLLAQFPNGIRLDTGKHYRTLTYWALRDGVPIDDPVRIGNWVETLDFGTWLESNESFIVVNDRVVFPELLTSSDINANVSTVACIPLVRQRLLDYQRYQIIITRSNGYTCLIAEGRDLGTVVFPDADFKFFLEADPFIRQRRRDEEGLEDSVAERDLADRSRKAAPLACPPNAIRIDTSIKTPDEVVTEIINHMTM